MNVARSSDEAERQARGEDLTQPEALIEEVAEVTPEDLAETAEGEAVAEATPAEKA
jgi:hypothetical protein